MNPAQIQFEKNLNADLVKKLHSVLPSDVSKVQHYYVLPGKSSRGLQNGPKSNLHNGITVLVLHREVEGKFLNPIYTYVVCSKTDHFSRVVGHNLVMEKAIKFLELGSISFDTCDNFYCESKENNNEVLAKDVLRRIANKITNSLHRIPQEQKKEKTLPTSKELEKKLTEIVGPVEKIVYKHFTDTSIPRYLQHTYSSKNIVSGITFVSVFLSNGDVITSATICSAEDNFSRETGRQYALFNLITGKKDKIIEMVKRVNLPKVNQFMLEKGIK